MANLTITGMHFMRQRDAHGCISSAWSACVSAIYAICVEIRIVPVTGLAQGRIVSIAREAPPPKPR